MFVAGLVRVQLDESRRVCEDRQVRSSLTRSARGLPRPATARACATATARGRFRLRSGTTINNPARANRSRTRCASSPARLGSTAAVSTAVAQALRLLPDAAAACFKSGTT
jgi:hypothetical protein